jgi:arsenate reductase
MAEAILEHLAQGRVRAASAGEAPALYVSPLALRCLRSHGIATSDLRPKPWGEFFGLYKPPVRFLIALSDVYAAEADWSHDSTKTVKVNWGMPDPSALSGNDVDTQPAFEEAFEILDRRIRGFLALSFETMTDETLSRELDVIGQET